MTKLQHFRELKGISKYRLSKLSGLSITHLSRIENGERDIEDTTVRNVKKLAECLDIDYTELLD